MQCSLIKISACTSIDYGFVQQLLYINSSFICLSFLVLPILQDHPRVLLIWFHSQVKPNVWPQMHLFCSSDYQHNSMFACVLFLIYSSINKAVNTQLSKQIRGLELTVVWWDKLNFAMMSQFCDILLFSLFPVGVSFLHKVIISAYNLTLSTSIKNTVRLLKNLSLNYPNLLIHVEVIFPSAIWMNGKVCRRTDAFAIKRGCKSHWSHFRVDCFIPFCSGLILLVHGCVFIERGDHFCIGRMIFNRAVKDVSVVITVVKQKPILALLFPSLLAA